MPDQTEPEQYRFVDGDDFCLSARLLPDLDNGGVTDTLSITIEGSDEPQSVHVRAAEAPAVAAGILRAAGQEPAVPAPPAAECSARHRRFDDGRLCIRAAQHHGDHVDERGFHWSDTVAVHPVDPGVVRVAPPAADRAAPVCKFEEGCHRVVACDPGCAVDRDRMYAQLAAASAPAADRADLRQHIAKALAGTALRPPFQHSLAMADVVLAVLAEHGQDSQRAAAEVRAALLRDLAEEAEEWDGHITKQELRRLADETQPAEPTFVPPAAAGLPLPALESATEGANRLDAWARDPRGRNFLVHALVQLARDGWLRTEPGEGFETVRDREAPAPEDPAETVHGCPPDETQPEPVDDTTIHACPGRWATAACRCFDDEPAAVEAQQGEETTP